MRALLLSLLLAGCDAHVFRTTSVHLGGAAEVRHRANAREPRLFFGLRLSLIHRP